MVARNSQVNSECKFTQRLGIIKNHFFLLVVIGWGPSRAVGTHFKKT